MKKCKEMELSPEERLKEEISQVREKGVIIADQGRYYTKTGQEMVDLADVTLPLTEFIQPTTNIEVTLASWQTLNRRADVLLSGLSGSEEQVTVISGATGSSAYSSTSMLTDGIDIPALSPDIQPLAIKAVDDFNTFISRPALRQNVIDLLVEYGLHEAPTGKKSPIELFELAFQAYENPVTGGEPVSTLLLPMRECIQMVISRLLQRRPKQEKAKNNWDKVVSISNQLKRDSIDKDDISTWASQLEELIDELSEAKQGNLSLDEWRNRLNRATLFLDSFLKGLDQSKMRE